MKRIKVIIVSAMFMLSCSMAFADDYTVGLKKMFASNALESVDMDAYKSLIRDKSITADQVLDMIVEHAAVYYRENMSLDEFNSMVEFCTSQEYIYVRDRVVLGTKNLENDLENLFTESNAKVMIANILSGKKCKTTAKAACSPEYDAEIETFLELSNLDNIMNAVLPMFKESIMKEVVVNPDDEPFRPVMEKVVQGLGNVLTKECEISVANSLISNVSLEDLKKYNSITKQPFYAGMQKANAAFTRNIVNVSLKVGQEIMQK